MRALTLKALERRELTLEQIRGVLENVTVGVTLGVVDREMNVEKALADALAGMDDALLNVVEATRVALDRLGSAGQDYEDSYLKQASRDLERYEDALLQSVAKSADSAGEKIGAQWAQVLRKKKLTGTGTGAKAAATARDFAKRAQVAVRKQRETGFKAAHLLTQNIATLASGILIGMSEALQAKGAVSKRRTSLSKPRKRRGQARDGRSSPRKAQDDSPGQDVCAEDTRRARPAPRTAKRAKQHAAPRVTRRSAGRAGTR